MKKSLTEETHDNEVGIYDSIAGFSGDHEDTVSDPLEATNSAYDCLDDIRKKKIEKRRKERDIMGDLAANERDGSFRYRNTPQFEIKEPIKGGRVYSWRRYKVCGTNDAANIRELEQLGFTACSPNDRPDLMGTSDLIRDLSANKEISEKYAMKDDMLLMSVPLERWRKLIGDAQSDVECRTMEYNRDSGYKGDRGNIRIDSTGHKMPQHMLF